MLCDGNRAPEPRGQPFRRLREIKVGKRAGHEAFPIARGERDVIEQAVVLEELRDVLFVAHIDGRRCCADGFGGRRDLLGIARGDQDFCPFLRGAFCDAEPDA